MSLAAGTRLGPYEIIAAVGAGGMGEVYRARDTRLDRIVAVKVLPDALAVDPQFRERFDREARTASHVNHPHICAVYDVGDFRPQGAGQAVSFLVMEYLEGETLASRLDRGALPIDQVLKVATEIAGALDKAHRAGITHRDLKPANVMLTKAGSKLLDFGLARKDAAAALTVDAATVASGTRQAPLTQQGTILGTFQYMAPEQLEGQDADARTDLFAFGALLYEMTTGRKAFEGKTRTSLIASIVGSQPAPLSAVQPLTPPALEHVVRKCLEKDPDDRWQSAHDVAEELRWIAEAGSQAGVATTVGVRRKTRETIAWTVAALALGALAIGALARTRGRSEPPTYAFTIPQADGAYSQASAARVSPDGRLLCFAARTDPEKPLRLFVRRIDGFESKPLDGTERASESFAWGLDGHSIVFLAQGKVRVVDIDGVPARDVADAGDITGLAMNRDGVILAGTGLTGIRRVSAKGGAFETITQPDPQRHEQWHALPTFLPDGRHFLYISFVRDPSKREQPHYLYAGSLDSKESRFLGEIPSLARYVEPGFLVFVRDGTLMSVRFDAASLTMSGDPAPIADGVFYFKPIGEAEFSASFNGVLTWRPPLSGETLTWLDRAGHPAGSVGPVSNFNGMRLLPDASEVVAGTTDLKIGTPDLWLYGTRRPTATRLTFGAGFEASPVVTADGKRLFFASDAAGVPDVFVKEIGSAEDARPFITQSGEQVPLDVSPDGRFLLYATDDYKSGTAFDLFVASAADGGNPTPFVRTPFNEQQGRFSPDGRSIAYQSSESGRGEVYVKPFPGPGRARQVSTAGGGAPQWSADGKQLYFRQNKRVYVVETSPGEHEPRLLFETGAPFGQFEVAPDGQRFLMNLYNAESLQVPTRVILKSPGYRNPKRP